MKYETVDDVYAMNEKIRESLIATVTGLSEAQITFRADDRAWTIQDIVEHLAKVEIGITEISAKLLSKAETEGKTSDGKIRLSKKFIDKTTDLGDTKFQAPDRMTPTDKQTIAESLLGLENSRQSLNELRSKFESVDGTGFTFPHMAFGQMTAQDWLVLIGEHELKHLKQIKELSQRYDYIQDQNHSS